MAMMGAGMQQGMPQMQGKTRPGSPRPGLAGKGGAPAAQKGAAAASSVQASRPEFGGKAQTKGAKDGKSKDGGVKGEDNKGKGKGKKGKKGKGKGEGDKGEKGEGKRKGKGKKKGKKDGEE